MASNGTVDVIIQQQAIDNIAKANAALEVTLKNVIAINEASRKGSSTGNNPNSAANINKSNTASIEKLKLLDQTMVMQKKIIQSNIKLNNVRSTSNAKLVKNNFEIQRRNKTLKEAAVLSSRLSSEYEKQSVKLNQLRKKYKDVALTQGESSMAAKRLRIEVTKLDQRLKRVDAGVGQYQRNVGNYSKALRGATKAARAMAGAMGLMGGAFLIVSVVRNTIKRIREFDKVMQNLSGILNENRKDLSSLEKEIIRVAGASVKTSNEVAKLAETLVTLGKSKSEVIKLLEPVNLLSIGLEATSQEAGELLIQTLNAFGESSDEAQRYADIIAKMRTSTALDFERIKDALGFLAPTAKAAGVSFEETGAILGVLVDNGIKASRAGRLTSTSFIKLAQAGRTLESALDEIRVAQEAGVEGMELLKIAGDLFGARSAAIGLILANNKNKTAELTEEYKKAQGTLKELTDKQLESLDAKLKILDSTWEKLILSVEKGDGVISAFFKDIIKSATDTIQLITDLNVVISNMAGTGSFKGLLDLIRALPTGVEILSDIIGKQAEEIRLHNLRKGLLIELSGLMVDAAAKKGVLFTKEEVMGRLQHTNNGVLQERIDWYKKLLEEEGKLKEGEEDLIEVARKTIDHYNEIIKTTRELRDSTAETNEEYEAFNQTILDAENGIQRLKVKFQELIEVQSVSSPGLATLSPTPSNPLRDSLESTRRRKAGIISGTDDNGLVDRTPQVTETEGVEGSAIQDFLGSDEFQFAKDTFDSLIDLGNMLFDARIALIDAEIQANEDKYNLLFLMAEGDAEQQRLLAIQQEKERQKLEKKKRKELKKQAIINKAAAIVEIGINTAIAITNALGFGPPPVGIALAAIVGAIGVAQIATVIASPIPQFAKGGTMDKDGLAIVGDGGRKEVIKNPDGSIQVTPNKSTVVGLQKGAEIFPSIDAFNQEMPTDISDQIYSATVMASLSINNAQMKGYMQSQRVLDEKLLDAMLLNTQAIKKQKLSVSNNNSINLEHLIYKEKYTN